MLKDCPPDEVREMLSLMSQEARDILTCLSELEKQIGQSPAQ